MKLENLFLAVVMMTFTAHVHAQDPKSSAQESGKPRCEWGGAPRGGFPTWIEFKNARGKTVKRIKRQERSWKKKDRSYYHDVKLLGCKKGDYCVVVESRGSHWGDENDCEGGECHDLQSSTTLYFYAGSGQILWSKPKTIYAQHGVVPVVSTNDRRILFAGYENNAWFIETWDEKGHEKRLVLKDFLHLDRLGISDNGRYAWVQGAIKNQEIRFFDLEIGQTHDYEGGGHPAVSDDGLAQVWSKKTHSSPEKFELSDLVHSYQLK